MPQNKPDIFDCDAPLDEIAAFGEALSAMARMDSSDKRIVDARELLAFMITRRAYKIRQLIFPEDKKDASDEPVDDGDR